ncbi:MAG: HAMP domain-containing histidine kinase [Herminiimonas sp.]|nr:HAMP domain-containing histidine kinase [Herminiimonas sp.]
MIAQAGTLQRPKAITDSGDQTDPALPEKLILQQQVASLQSQILQMQEEARQQSERTALLKKLEETNRNLITAYDSMRQMKNDAEEVGRRHNEFIAMLAHELRGPMAPIAVAASLLEQLTDAHPKLSMVHGVLNRQVDNMKRLLDDLLDASRMSNGKIVFAKSPVLVADMVQAAVEISQPFIDQRKHTLNVMIEHDTMMVEGDPLRLAQVFSNLLINAAKFTPEGGEITIAAHQCGHMVEIAVVDNGVGMPAELLPRVFDLFTQGARSMTRTEGGLGIGLAMVHSIVLRHGGEVRGDSDGQGMGSEFVVTLPLSNNT